MYIKVPFKISFILIAFFANLAFSTAMHAQSMIRDAEIEATLRKINDPIFRAAGLSPKSVKIYIVNSRKLNAFVAGGQNIFLNSGLLTRLKTPEMIQAVVAHETAHITGGHLARLNQAVKNARTISGVGMALAIAAAASGNNELGQAAAITSTQIAQRNLLAHTRAEEASADQASINFMVRAGINPSSAIEVQNIFRGQELLSGSQRDPYSSTHPLTTQRMQNLQGRVARYKNMPTSISKSTRYWHARMVAKFQGHLLNPKTMLSKAKKSGSGEIATLIRAIAYHRLPNQKKAMANVNALIKARPKDPYYRELKGQFLLENGHPSAAVNSYQRAVSLAPNTGLIRAGLGRAYLALNSQSGYKNAVITLQKARNMDPYDRRLLRDLALAYAKVGKNGDAALATAERFALGGRFKDAARHAKHAQGLLPRGSVGWTRANDILEFAKRSGQL